MGGNNSYLSKYTVKEKFQFSMYFFVTMQEFLVMVALIYHLFVLVTDYTQRKIHVSK